MDHEQRLKTGKRDKLRETKPGRKHKRWKEQEKRHKTETEREDRRDR